MNINYKGEDRWFNDVFVREGLNWIEGDRLSRLLAHPEWVQINAPVSRVVIPSVEVLDQDLTAETDFLMKGVKPKK